MDEEGKTPSFFILWHVNLGSETDDQKQFLLISLTRESLGKEILEDTRSENLIELYNLKSSKAPQFSDSDRN